MIQKLQLEGYAIQVVDVDAEPRLCRRFNIEVIPGVLLVIDGKEAVRITGLTTNDKLKALVER